MLTSLTYTFRSNDPAKIPAVRPMLLDPEIAAAFVRANEAINRAVNSKSARGGQTS